VNELNYHVGRYFGHWPALANLKVFFLFAICSIPKNKTGIKIDVIFCDALLTSVVFVFYSVQNLYFSCVGLILGGWLMLKGRDKIISQILNEHIFKFIL